METKEEFAESPDRCEREIEVCARHTAAFTKKGAFGVKRKEGGKDLERIILTLPVVAGA